MIWRHNMETSNGFYEDRFNALTRNEGPHCPEQGCRH
jgi:hypothetical protein